jgi:hypothetical protein
LRPWPVRQGAGTETKEKKMSKFRFAELPSNESVASLTTLVVSAWFLVAAGAMLVEPTVESQARALARTPVVTIKELSVSEAVQPDARFTIEVAARRHAGRVS